ncbi:MAG: hypothetical protein J6K61_00245 [Clostridia bacterium]|nr:hypothetical protein [Clostridia bacterium]
MKKSLALLLALLLTFPFLLSSCGQKGDFLFYQREAFCLSVVYTENGIERKGTMQKEANGTRRFAFTAPEELSGISVCATPSTEGEIYTLSYEDMSETVSSSAEGLLSAFSLLNLAPQGRLTQKSGMAFFKTEQGNATVKCREDGYPYFISLERDGFLARLDILEWEGLP